MSLKKERQELLEKKEEKYGYKKAMLASFFIIIVLAAGISLLYFRFQPVPEESQNKNPEHYITPAVGNTRNASYLRLA